ncbi:Pyoverdine/dityrosine biosynthesis protein-domain-containing protein [Podospora appendiculata]|uniref:Pyoverdine/dityrosine biosynthesis protein-domain-containing protein n=1 Tax=Podospora appendiculata TaxID=314037 RepID=A0AAE0XAS4_9PEZI|nr:Pyoverdine/dityrosine biosynthesis protein-domain-containing protein [Podospora appendiculata]
MQPHDSSLDPNNNADPNVSDNAQKVCDILGVIYRYRLESCGGPLPDADDRATRQFHALIYNQVRSSQPVRLCLPAFPFKSPNSQSKVLGRLPDKAEEFALAHINGLCAAIGDIYTPGAELTIISDGLVYNDLLTVPDRDVWAYGQALRALTIEKEFKHIKFSRLNDLLQTDIPGELDEIAYIANATNFRRALLNKFSRPDWDPSEEIKRSEDTCLTYRGYIKFLETDLENVYPVGPVRSKSKFKRGIELVAKQMLTRGDAFARAVRERFPTHVRLSIHRSTNKTKLSISLLPTQSRWTTPWHCALAVTADGTIQTGPSSQFAADPAFELVYNEHGQLSHYREKTDLLAWADDAEIDCQPMYPCGLLIRPAGGPMALSIADVDATRLRGLAELNSPVVLRDFAHTGDRALFVKMAGELGTPLPWSFGLVLEVKDLGAGSKGSGGALSSERMAFHYDGVFKTEKRTRVDGSEEVVSVPPCFQLFTAVTPSPKDSGYTLFADSKLLFQHLPAHLSIEILKQLTWSVSTASFNAVDLKDLPLVVSHPATGKPCLRYHEPWPQSKTDFEPMEVAVRGSDGVNGVDVCKVIDALLYDRRVTYWHAWQKGDLLVSDNVSMMHTRTEFVGGSDRELWRIHFDRDGFKSGEDEYHKMRTCL